MRLNSILCMVKCLYIWCLTCHVQYLIDSCRDKHVNFHIHIYRCLTKNYGKPFNTCRMMGNQLVLPDLNNTEFRKNWMCECTIWDLFVKYSKEVKVIFASVEFFVECLLSFLCFVIKLIWFSLSKNVSVSTIYLLCSVVVHFWSVKDFEKGCSSHPTLYK